MSALSVDTCSRLLRSGDFADCVVISGGREIKVHQNIVCSQSPILKRLCEQGLQNFRSVRLEFAECDLPTVSRVFLYLYTNTYNDEFYPNLGCTTSSVASALVDLSPHVEDSPNLQDVPNVDAAESIKSPPAASLAENNLKVYLCAKILEIEPLKALAMEKIEGNARNAAEPAVFATILSHVYANTTSEDTELRTGLIRVCADNLTHVQRDASLLLLVKKYEPIVWHFIEQMRTKTLEARATRASDAGQQAEIGRLKAETEHLRSEKEKPLQIALGSFYQNTPSSGSSLSAEMLRLRLKNNDLKIENSNLEKAADQLKQQRENPFATVLGNLKRNPPGSGTSLSAELLSLRTENNDLRAENGNLRAENNNLEKQIDQIQRDKENALRTALVSFKPTAPSSSSEMSNLRTKNKDLRAENSSLTKGLSCLTVDKNRMDHELKQQRQKRHNAEANMQAQIQKLKNKLSNAESQLGAVNSAGGQAYDQMRSDNEDLTSQVHWLRGLVEQAERRVNDVRECRRCDRAFWATLKVDWRNHDVYVKCGSCGLRH